GRAHRAHRAHLPRPRRTRVPRREHRERSGRRPHARERTVPLLLPARSVRARRMNVAANGTPPALALPRVLVAGIGNLFLRDDGFGAEVARRLRSRSLRDGVCVFEFGTGGLDLVYELMRGYDALILVDISRRGEAPGTLYVIEPSPVDVHGGDGVAMDPHAMDPETVLRFVKTISGWPAKVLIVA